MARPTLKELITRVKNDFQTEMSGSDPFLRRTVEYVQARLYAGLVHGLYGYLYGYVMRQIFPDTASEQNFWRWARIFGIEKKAAVYWKGTYEFTGTDTTAIPAGTTLQRSDDETYTTDADAAISGTTIEVNITAVTPGATQNCDDGQVLSLTSPIAGIDTDGEVTDTTQTGTDLETKEEGYPRLELQIQQPPSGGGPGDYERWALEVSGVTRAWEFPQLTGLGSVSVAFVRDNESPITPDLTERNEVLDYIELYRPVTADVEIIELSEVAVAVTLTSLSPNTAAVQAAIEESLEDMLIREGAPNTTLTLSKFTEAIATATGEDTHVMSVPAADVVLDYDEIPVLGTVTFP